MFKNSDNLSRSNKPREIDYLAYLLDEHKSDLSAWELGFCESCLKGLRDKYAFLTTRQHDCLMKIVVKHNLAKDEYCVKGYADRTDQEVVRNSGTGTTKAYNPNRDGEDSKIDDMDDDVPF